jgi:hypothetical protein
MRKANRYQFLPDGTAVITLTRGQVTLVDARDLPRVLPYRWFTCGPAGGPYRAMARVDGRLTYLHAVVLGVKDADHRNRNMLDNRRANLRRATRSQNLANRAAYGKHSRYKGVYPNKAKWFAKIVKAGTVYFSPSFLTEEEAALWYNEKAKELHGDFAVLNEIVQ